METYQIRLGLPDIIYNYNHKKIEKQLEDTWIMSQWKFLNQNKIKMLGWKYKIKPQCEGDKFLMIELMNSNIDEDTLWRLNNCRKYLKILSLSDMTTGDGDIISAECINGVLPHDRNTQIIWETTTKPPPRD